MRERGDISESQLDAARSEHLARQAQTEVTQARIARARADLEAARIRLGYTQVKADWQGGGDERVVAERLVDAGQTVAANAPLVRVVELDPMTTVFYVTERDYGQLRQGQQASLSTDAFPSESFHGQVQRVAPVFSEATRQARVELAVDNPGRQLKPGMFVRATLVLRREKDAVIVPSQALTKRNEQRGVFVVARDGNKDGDGASARWLSAKVGIEQDDKVQLLGAGLSAGDRVVVLGQQLLDDGASLRISGDVQ